jgi:hypothetical protein
MPSEETLFLRHPCVIITAHAHFLVVTFTKSGLDVADLGLKVRPESPCVASAILKTLEPPH